MSEPSEKALQEFLSEAQEIVETFNRDLLALDEGRAAGRYDPDLVNSAFRAVHSLKGLAGLFGVTRMTSLSHNLENLLDSLRLGRVELTSDTLDLLFEAVSLFNRIISDTAQPNRARGESAQEVGVEDLIERLDRIGLRREAVEPAAADYEIDPGLLSVLTEYEEHRLRENISQGRTLYRIHAAFDLLTIDKGLDQLKARLKPVGEVITYLPSSESKDEHSIELDVVLGASVPLAEVRQAALEGAGPHTTVEVVPRKVRPEGVQPAPRPPPQPRPALPTLDDGTELSLKSVAQTVRVDIRKLDHLMNIVGELAITRSGFQDVLDALKGDVAQTKLARALHHELRALDRKLDELQQGILDVRMVPLGQVFEKLSRVVRKISRDAGKEIRLQITGADTELDKLIVEELSDPLMHVIRNAIAHGIERTDARQRAGKSEAGLIAISAEQRGNHVVIEIEDDGAGIDRQGLVKSAIDRGALDPDIARELPERDVFNLLFLPGVSTKQTADEMSGRGVGMDVVKTNIARLSGIIDVASEPGVGTRFTITLPITLAIIQALIVRAAGRVYAIPLNSVLESLRVTANEVMTIERREVMGLRGQTLPLARLERLFDLRRDASSPMPARQFVVVVGLAQHRIGLLVDELQGQQDIVIKSLGRALAKVRGIAGATELGSRRTVLVLDVASIVEDAVAVQTIEAA